jgi:Uma2 family endonuclease
MEMMSPGAALIPREAIRPLKRVEYEQLVAQGCFEDERVELVFGAVVTMSPPDPAHSESIRRLDALLTTQLGDRAVVDTQNPFAATDDSEPQPDVFVVPAADYWRAHPTRAFLIIEVSRSSLAYDQGPKALLYGAAEIDEYWIVDHVHSVVRVHRDRRAGTWRSITTHDRGEVLALAAFPDVEIAVAAILPPA